MNKLLKALWARILHHREIFIFLPAATMFIYLVIRFVNFLTGRAVIEDPGVLVDYLFQLYGCMILTITVGQVQSHLFGYRVKNSARANSEPKLSDDLYDACVTLILLGFFGYIFFFR